MSKTGLSGAEDGGIRCWRPGYTVFKIALFCLVNEKTQKNYVILVKKINATNCRKNGSQIKLFTSCLRRFYFEWTWMPLDVSVSGKTNDNLSFFHYAAKILQIVLF